MGYHVNGTDEAVEDLHSAAAFIAEHNPTAAVRLEEAIVRKSMRLADHPRLGRVVTRFQRENLGEIPVSLHQIIYEIEDRVSSVYVRVLWHGARQEPEHLSGP